MINKNNKYLGAAIATLAVAGLVAAPQASAKKAKVAPAESAAAVSKTELLESQLRAMQDEIATLRAQVNASAPVAAKVAADSQKVQELDAWAASVKAKHAETHGSLGNGGNMLYFRGGYSGNDSPLVATTNSIGGPNAALSTGSTGHRDGWNFGAGIDFKLNDNMFGLLDKTELLGELDLNYVDLGTFSSSVGGLTVPLTGYATATQSMLRISASPKIKFLKDSKIRPWLIPVGFTLNVISPPSQANSITELKPAMNFGTGVDYNVWKSLYVGADVRYFLATDTLDGTNVNGLTAGGTLGFGF
ncbi:MAG: porin family protein [Methylococcales bacterium]|nr:porin family protein [Methylococcales bacterium]